MKRVLSLFVAALMVAMPFVVSADPVDPDPGGDPVAGPCPDGHAICNPIASWPGTVVCGTNINGTGACCIFKEYSYQCVVNGPIKTVVHAWYSTYGVCSSQSNPNGSQCLDPVTHQPVAGTPGTPV